MTLHSSTDFAVLEQIIPTIVNQTSQNHISLFNQVFQDDPENWHGFDGRWSIKRVLDLFVKSLTAFFQIMNIGVGRKTADRAVL